MLSTPPKATHQSPPPALLCSAHTNYKQNSTILPTPFFINISQVDCFTFTNRRRRRLPMGCGNLFFTLVIICSAALITYNIIISANAPLKQDFPDASSTNKLRSSFSADPIIKMPTDRARKSKRLFHTAVTASDSIYNTWQCRVMYYWFKKQKSMPNSEMGGFTRILHSGKPDRFMDEMPTFVAQPLPSGMDQVFCIDCTCSLPFSSSLS